MRTYRTLDADEIAALQAFAKEKGRRWKSVLNEVYWYNARIWEEWTGMKCSKDKGYLLHGLRNSHGPTWLDGFKLPKDGAK
jgi:hypothetical protein